MSKEFTIVGMTCATCVNHVDKAVNNLKGINKVTVNLLTNSMKVDFDDKQCSINNIIAAVKNAGYEAKLIDKQTPKDFSTSKKKKNNLMRLRIIISLVFLIPLFYVSMGPMIGIPLPAFLNIVSVNAITQFILLLPIVIVNFVYFQSGFIKLFKLKPNMDSLIAVGSFTAIAYGIYTTIQLIVNSSMNDMGHQDIYFEVAGAILAFFTIGKYLENFSKNKTLSALEKLMNLTPDKTIKIENGIESEVLVALLQVGDHIVIKPGAMIPVDGIIVEGQSTIDQASITGEPIPVEKQVGDEVIGATINQRGYFIMKATKVGEDTTIAQIIHLVEEAANSKAKMAKLVDKVAGIFVPIVFVIAIVSFIIWLVLEQDVAFAISISVAILVISCPCALGLATPVTIMVGAGKGAELGILSKSAEAFEKLDKVTTIVLDKTGTITTGRPQVIDVITYDFDEEKLIQIVASIESLSEHPLAQALIEERDKRKLKSLKTESFDYTLGKGVSGIIDGQQYLIGNRQFITSFNIDLSMINNAYQQLSNEGKTVLIVSNKLKIFGLISIADTLKPTTNTAINQFKAMNKKIVLLTGDNELTAKTIANQLAVDNVISEVMPSDKERVISELQNKGEHVLMIGDGINDAPALMRADVGMAIGAGTDIAIESADIVLIKSDLMDAVNAIKLSNKVVKNIKINLFWAFIYNVIAIPIAAGLLFYPLGLTLNPMIAALTMSLSSISVVLNALRLRRFKGINVN
jgi:heavy metal translocating P-type ATPase